MYGTFGRMLTKVVWLHCAQVVLLLEAIADGTVESGRLLENLHGQQAQGQQADNGGNASPTTVQGRAAVPQAMLHSVTRHATTPQPVVVGCGSGTPPAQPKQA